MALYILHAKTICKYLDNVNSNGYGQILFLVPCAHCGDEGQ